MNTKEIVDAERKLVQNGAQKIVSTWFSPPYIMGVLDDGCSVIVSEMSHLPSEHPGKRS